MIKKLDYFIIKLPIVYRHHVDIKCTRYVRANCVLSIPYMTWFTNVLNCFFLVNSIDFMSPCCINCYLLWLCSSPMMLFQYLLQLWGSSHLHPISMYVFIFHIIILYIHTYIHTCVCVCVRACVCVCVRARVYNLKCRYLLDL